MRKRLRRRKVLARRAFEPRSRLSYRFRASRVAPTQRERVTRLPSLVGKAMRKRLRRRKFLRSADQIRLEPIGGLLLGEICASFYEPTALKNRMDSEDWHSFLLALS